MKVISYVFDGPKGNCRVVHFEMLETHSMYGIKMMSDKLQEEYPGMSLVICDSHPAVKKAFWEAKKLGSFAAWIEFYDYVSGIGFVS